MIVQIDMQDVDGTLPFIALNFLRSIGNDDAHAWAIFRQFEPPAAGMKYAWIELNGRASPLQFFITKLGQAGSTQTQLHGVPSCD